LGPLPVPAPPRLRGRLARRTVRFLQEYRLVLARRRWTVPQALFPGRDRQESEAGSFLRIRRWREELDLPEEVFVRIEPPPAGKIPSLRDHLAKPQYVDFRNPCWSLCSAG